MNTWAGNGELEIRGNGSREMGYENGRCTHLAQIIHSGRVLVLFKA
jgi:hypothetical protein